MTETADPVPAMFDGEAADEAGHWEDFEVVGYDVAYCKASSIRRHLSATVSDLDQEAQRGDRRPLARRRR